MNSHSDPSVHPTSSFTGLEVGVGVPEFEGHVSEGRVGREFIFTNNCPGRDESFLSIL